jgi:hypothetical protein
LGKLPKPKAKALPLAPVASTATTAATAAAPAATTASTAPGATRALPGGPGFIDNQSATLKIPPVARLDSARRILIVIDLGKRESPRFS